MSQSSQFPPEECPLCDHPQLWRGALICPGCNGDKQISCFKVPKLFLDYPELSKVKTLREMKAVRPEDE